MTITVRKLYIILAVALSVSAITIGVVIVWTNLSSHHLRAHHQNATSELEINESEPESSGRNNGIGSSIHFPNPLRMLASSLSSEKIVTTADAPPIVVPRLIERHMYVVDMIQCDKTFAALKYKLWVRVPENTPPFKQRPNPNVMPMSQQQHRQRRPSGYLTNQQWTQHQHSTTPLEANTNNNSTISHRLPRSMQSDEDTPETMSAVNGEQHSSVHSDEQNKSTIRRILDALLERRQRRAGAEASAESIGELEKDHELASAESQLHGSVNVAEHADVIVDSSELVPIEQDPIELAGSELDLMSEEATPSAHIKASILNRTLVDCFMVDTEKRYQQKVDIEHRYRHIVNTRQVEAHLMNEAIDRCTKLVEFMSPDKITIVRLNETASPSANTSAHSSAGFFNPFQPIANSGFFENILASALGPMEQQQAAANSNQVVVVTTPTTTPNQVNEKQLANSRIVNTNTGANNNQTGSRGLSNYVSAGVSMINGIVPNTLWCGLGDRAANYSELGTEYRVDACCRAHDHCPVRLRPFTNDYNLMNWSVSTRSHCACDSQFNQCLAKVNSTLANVIRVIYFRFVGLQCIELNTNIKLQAQSHELNAAASSSDVRQASPLKPSSFLSSASNFVFG